MRAPKDKSVDDLSMKIFIGITTHTLSLVMSYHLQKCFGGGQSGTLGSVEELCAHSVPFRRGINFGLFLENPW